jgi:hypothetical protein
VERLLARGNTARVGQRWCVVLGSGEVMGSSLGSFRLSERETRLAQRVLGLGGPFRQRSEWCTPVFTLERFQG